MTSKNATLLIIGILTGGSFGYILAFNTYAPKVYELTSSLTVLEDQYQSLSEEHITILSNYKTLTQEYETVSNQKNSLQNQYTTLNSRYNTLQYNYNDLSYDYDKVCGYLNELSNGIRNLNDTLRCYTGIPESFCRVLNEEELDKIGSTVSSITHGSEDLWYSTENIYEYIIDNIKYTHDVEIPYISLYYHISLNNEDIITSFNTDTIMNYIQTPEYTIEYKQGDCDDQAILLYAMIKYYERVIYETEYTLYLTHIEFTDNSGHVAVFMPVQDGQLCILDPAGHYLTSRYGRITQKVASTELQKYSDNWTSTTGHIKEITLYKINVVDGSYVISASGTLDEISTFLEKT